MSQFNNTAKENIQEKISIIIPIYNAESTLLKSLCSLQNQTYQNLEVIMIDDGSTDNSADICKQFSKEDRRFIYIYQKNAGVSSARNNGLKNITGQYIGFCDADDWADEDMYEVLHHNLVCNNADISICSLYTDYPNKNDVLQNTGEMRFYNSKEAIAEMHKGGIFEGQLWNKLFKTEILKGLLLPTDIAIFEDMVFMWDAFLKSNKIVFQSCKKYHYLQNPVSALHQFKESFWSIQKACDIMLEQMKNIYPDMVHLANRTVLSGNVMLAIRLCDNKKLTKENYDRIIKKIKPCYHKGLFSWKKGIMAKLLLLNRHLFVVGYYIRRRLKRE